LSVSDLLLALRQLVTTEYNGKSFDDAENDAVQKATNSSVQQGGNDLWRVQSDR
jgi:hypothetical protein